MGLAIALLTMLLLGSPAAEAVAPPPTATPTSTAQASTAAFAGSATAAAPSLSIAVDNGKTDAAVGDRLDYTVTVKNLGRAAVKNLIITQTMPAGLKFDSADRSGVSKAGRVSWQAELPAGSSTSFHTSTIVTETPADLLRLASMACAATTPDARPIVCATHTDALPALAVSRQASTAGRSATADRAWWYVGGGAVLIAALVAVFVLRRRSRQDRPA